MSDQTADYRDLAKAYHQALNASATSPAAGEPEAQLTVPVSNLISGLASRASLGSLRLIRETRLDRTRPDFAVLHTKAGKTHQKGYIELKAPDVSVDASIWKGRNATQWQKMKEEAEILIVCNGAGAQLYHHGVAKGPPAPLPIDDPHAWRAEPLIKLLGRFLELKPAPITRVTDLSKRLAVRTADLRDRLLWLLEQSGPAPDAAKGGYAAWQAHVYPDASARDFADGISQVVAYGMVLAALSPGHPDFDDDGYISVAEARAAIRPFSPVLAAAFAPLVDKPVLFEAAEAELGALETLISAIDPIKVNATADRRGDPWLYFFENFLEVYDPDERRQAGVYYTPVPVVGAMAAITEHLLVNRFGKRLGFADSGVVTLDPATGTGTFPLAVIDRAVASATLGRGKGGPQQAGSNLGRNLFAFELLPGPYSVAHLRLSQRLSRLSKGQVKSAHVILTDTLESPLERKVSLSLFGDAEVLAAEQSRARSVKLEQKVTVAIGNPPYRRVARDVVGRGSGGWVINGEVPERANKKQSLFDDILDVAKANTIFSHHASLYNLYVYFWRWTIWKVFEAHGDGPGIISFITASSWLHGPGFVGLRQMVREVCDEVWVIDLGGDNKGANPEENIFAIETPVAIVTMVRDGTSDRGTPAPVHYRRIRGTKEAKLDALTAVGRLAKPLDGDWINAPSAWTEPFVPLTGDAVWDDIPLITDLFPWQQPGCKFGRTWPIAPSEALLTARWKLLARTRVGDRQAMFVTGSSGRNIKTKVAGLKTIAEVKSDEASEDIKRYGYRSFDRQWAFDDPRTANLERPSLWQTLSSSQFFLCSLLTGQISSGPALTVSADIPDLHYFRGNFGGKDIIPMWRDAAATLPNMTAGLAAKLGRRLGIAPPSVTDLAAYSYALLCSNAYQERFAVALQTPGLRVPVTADHALWTEAIATGRELLWLHTYAERFVDADAGRGAYVPDVEGIGWEETVTTIPADPSEVDYDEATGSLTVGNGRVGGVRPEVWKYSVSGMAVLPKWLGYRTAKGAGRAASSKSALDKVRPTEWADEWNDELLDLIRVLTLTVDRQAELANLLERICAGPLIPAGDLPMPTKAERQPPVTLRR